jgi:hypothetical protein
LTAAVAAIRARFPDVTASTWALIGVITGGRLLLAARPADQLAVSRSYTPTPGRHVAVDRASSCRRQIVTPPTSRHRSPTNHR